MRSLIGLGVVLTSFNSFGCNVEDQISRLNDRLTYRYVKKLSESFCKHAIDRGLPPSVLVAIAKVESDFKPDAVNNASNDYGIMQINKYNIRAYKMDIEKLITDFDYGIEAGARVYSWFYYKYTLDESIKRYNCGTKRSCTELKSVKRYLRMVKSGLTTFKRE